MVDTSPMTPVARAKPAESLARRSGAGALWIAAATFGGRILSFLAQIVLGWLLSKNDFGIYAAAVSLSAATQGMLQGGTRNILIQKGERHWRWLAGPAFWVALLFNGFAALALAGVAGGMALLSFAPGTAFADPRLPILLLVIAATFVLTTPEVIFRARFSMKLQFRTLSSLTIQRQVVQYASMILLALAGAGPMSFVLPLLFATLYTTAISYWHLREKIWRNPLHRRLWPALLSRSKWLVLTAVTLSLLNQGDYLALGGLVPAAILGIYYFAFQIVMQLQLLLGTNLQNVLLPVMSRIKDEPERFRSGLLRALRVLTLFGCAAGFGMAAIYAPLEHLIWHGKWASSVLPVQVFAACFPFRMLWSMVNISMMASAAYRKLAALTAIAAAGLVASAAISGLIWDDATLIALGVSLYFVFGLTGLVILAMRDHGIRPGTVLSAILPAWAIGMVCDLVTSLTAQASGLQTAPIADLAIRFILFTLLYLAATRLLIPGSLRAAASAFPVRLSRPLMRIVFLKEAT